MKVCGDVPPWKQGTLTCILKLKHREPHSDGARTWVYYCEACDAQILKAGMCKRCGGKQLADEPEA